MRQISRILLAISIAFTSVACSSLGSDQLNDIFASKSSKDARLKERVDQYHQALYWGAPDTAVVFVSPELRRDMMQQMIADKQKLKIVDLNIDYIDYQDDDVTAQIDVRVRYYPIPSYTIETRVDQETWKFDRFGGGWFLVERKVREELGKDSFQFN